MEPSRLKGFRLARDLEDEADARALALLAFLVANTLRNCFSSRMILLTPRTMGANSRDFTRFLVTFGRHGHILAG